MSAVADFIAWLDGDGPNPYEYYRGDLAMLPLERRPPVASYALQMATCPEPRVVIAQRRHGEHDYSYLAWRVVDWVLPA